MNLSVRFVTSLPDDLLSLLSRENVSINQFVVLNDVFELTDRQMNDLPYMINKIDEWRQKKMI